MSKVQAPQGAAVHTTWTDTPTQTINAGGVEFAYRAARPRHRRAGGLPHPPGRRPGQLGPPSRGRHRRQASGHHLRQPRCRCLQRVHADDHPGDGDRRRHLHSCPRLGSGRPVRVLHGRHDRPGHRPGGAAAGAQDDPRRDWPCGGRRHRQGDPHLPARHRPRTAHPPGPQAVPLLHQDAERAPSREGSSWPGCRNGPATATRPSPSAPSAPSSRPSTDGVSSSPPTSPASTSPCSPSTVTATRWCRPTNTVDLDRRLPNSQLVLYPDAGHGGVFQFHQDFVKRALEFL